MLGFGAIAAWAISYFGGVTGTPPVDPGGPTDPTNPPGDPSGSFSVKVRYIRLRAPLSSKTNFK